MKQFFICAFLLLSSGKLLACPCGCGAINAQVMAPGESWKYALGLSNDSGFKTVKSDGELGADTGPKTKNTLSFAIARSLNQSLSTTLTLQLHQNRHPNENSDYAVGDPSFSLRYTALRQSFVNPFIPQIQLFSTYKHPVAKSNRGEVDREYQMDVHGNGFAEMVGGVDLGFEMTNFKYSFSEMLIYPFERKFTNEGYTTKVQQGWGHKESLSVGYNFIAVGTLVFSVDREARAKLQVNNKNVHDSEVLVHSATASGNYRVGMQKTVGLAFKRTAAFSNNKNTTRADSITLSFMQAT